MTTERPKMIVPVPVKAYTLQEVLDRVTSHIGTNPGRCMAPINGAVKSMVCAYRDDGGTNGCFVGLFLPDDPAFDGARNARLEWTELVAAHPIVRLLFSPNISDEAMKSLQQVHDNADHWDGDVLNWRGGAALLQWAKDYNASLHH